MTSASTSTPDASPAPAAPAPALRLVSLDAYRGLVMLLMMAEVLHLAKVSASMPEFGFWKFLADQQTHVPWVGCSLHDLIQPSFSFIVGVALPFSLASRSAQGQSRGRLALHAFWRALLLVLLGVFLRSIGAGQTQWTFEDTLTQIGLGYGFLFLLGLRPARDQWIAFAAILVGYWMLFALWPLPPEAFDWRANWGSADWQNHLTGFAGHWNKNTNPAWAFDTWFLNLFPRVRPFTKHVGGYCTLNFIPTLATMILGLLAGGALRRESRPVAKLRWLAGFGLAFLAAGALLGWTGICPVVKRIWTPGWVLFSGGWCLLLSAGFYSLIDWKGWKKWSYPLVVVGMNSIAAYCMAHLCEDFISTSLRTHLGVNFFRAWGPAYEPLLLGCAVLLVYWLILWWMLRRRIFLRI